MTEREPLFKGSADGVMFDVFGFKTEDGITLAHLLNKAVEHRVKEACKKVRNETIRLCADKADRMESQEIRNAIMFGIRRQ
jgi:hypothetical protein